MIKLNEELFSMMYEMEDIIEIEEDGYYNACDISVSENETFLLESGIVSHNSASNSISSILGRQGLGYYAMFGVPPNAYDMNMSKIIKSDKLKALQKIIGLKYSETTQRDLNFKNIIIATDADLPGFFIRGQLLGLFYRFGRNLFEEGKIKILNTPLFVCTDKKEKIVAWFYDFKSQKDFEDANKGKGYLYEYKKGLSSWDKSELQTVIDKDGFENMLDEVTLGDVEEELKESADLFDSWLNGKNADTRKEMLEGFEFNILNM